MQNKLAVSLASDRLIFMQMPFQLSRLSLRVGVLFACANLLLVLFPASLHCDPYASTWAIGPESSLRLIAAGGGAAQGAYRAGIEIRLDPGALTYWRTPGAAGVPPVFSFEGSANAAAIAVSYPAPARIDEAGTEVFGYRGQVIFPVRVTPKDSSRPVLLALSVSYAVCAKICLPASGAASLSLLPGEQAGAGPAGPEAAAIAAAEALVPVHVTPQQRNAKVTITREETAPSPAWRLLARGGAQDVFAEAPPGWYFETRITSRPNEFLIVEAERPPADTAARPPLVLTVKNEQQSYEFAVDLDAVSVPAKNVQSGPEISLRSTQN